MTDRLEQWGDRLLSRFVPQSTATASDICTTPCQHSCRESPDGRARWILYCSNGCSGDCVRIGVQCC